MQQYRLKKLFADVWAVESWGVVNFDGMPDYDWKHVKTYHGDTEAVNGYELHKYGSVSVGKDYFATYEDNDKIIAMHQWELQAWAPGGLWPGECQEDPDLILELRN